MQKVFFYGLFMDHELLLRMGFHPVLIGEAVLKGYRIHIGEKASLIPADSSSVYGILMELSEDEITRLYTEPGVQDYKPESVLVQQVNDKKFISAVCYNLQINFTSEKVNSEYASKLSLLAKELNFNSDYIEKIKAFCRK